MSVPESDSVSTRDASHFALEFSPSPTARLSLDRQGWPRFRYRNRAWLEKLNSLEEAALAPVLTRSDDRDCICFCIEHAEARYEAQAHLLGNEAIVYLQSTRLTDEALLRLRLLERAVSACTAGITITRRVDGHNLLQMVNPAFCRLSGYTEAELLNRDPRFLQGERPQKATHQLHHAIANDQETRVELVNFNKDGEPYELDLHIAPVEANGKPEYFVGVQLDISRQRAAERERDERDFMYHRLEALIVPAQRKAVAAEMGDMLIHELAQPVAAMSNYTNALKHLLDNRDEHVARVMERLSAMVDRCRASIERTRKLFLMAPEKPAVIDLANIIRSTTRLLDRKCAQRNITLEVDLPDTLMVKSSGSEVELLFFTILRSLLVSATDAPERVTLTHEPNGADVTIRVASEPAAFLADCVDNEWAFLMTLFEATGVKGRHDSAGLYMSFLNRGG